ncbi:DUF2344 domain-containing protein [Jiangella aurantiaca]|uniref:DUF2344 domain-containing protein n=1 Tax=Jiangella aurantiaca TaxID=2530373 RepID=A0A4R5ADQ3_9ACTN|nr:TIGR03936 family radical SAM-associated protein [Jiangella aurantiaca]TDD69239.1 DUF2344 domain-containing protein [Jiangella aurantiaca]
MSTAPHQQLPAVQRLRVRFAKRGRLRFTSHRDFQRAFERALRRADVPMAWSQGFTPHPRVSYAGAAPTGAASEAEYLELAVTRVCDPEQVRAALDSALPPGLDIVEVVEAGPGALADRLQASSWAIQLPGAVPEQAAAAVTAFLTAASVPVERLTKNGVRQLDPRAAVLRLTADTAADPVTLRAVIRHQSPTVRPDEVLAGLRIVAGFTPPQPPRAVRLAQGVWDDDAGVLADPLADAPGRHDP